MERSTSGLLTGGVPPVVPVAVDPIRVPSKPDVPPAPPFPLVSAVVPVVGALVLWLATGSSLTLWFAALGPLVAVAGMLDGRRGRRRSRRATERQFEERLQRAGEALGAGHERERGALWARHPDVDWHLARPEETWRSVEARGEWLVVGRGEAASAVRVEGDGDDEGARRMRERARVLSDAPVLVPLTAGVAISGPPVLAWAVARGLLLQACLNLAPGHLRVDGASEEWARDLPHARSTTGPLMRVLPAGAVVPAEVEVPVAIVAEGDPPPPRCHAVLTLLSPRTARLDRGAVHQTVLVEPISRDQARAIAASLADRAVITHGSDAGETPPLTELIAAAPPPTSSSLPAVIGTAAGAPVIVDLVAEGPHAVVIGVTGSGKSELLITWVASLAATHTPQEVSFLLVDFKGGRSFDALTVLPHVTGVLTDLDEQAALRAIESLRAETRHRERVLASVGARDVAESHGALSRLVIVVDEYAALVAAYPALHELFGDLAARGRALGMHLIVSSQRAAGVFRDALLANAPLRLALRVTEAADSRSVLGADDAARLSGRPDDRGVCLVRGPADSAPRTVRVSRCRPHELAAFAQPDAVPARRPWLPPLAECIPLDEHAAPGTTVVGVADEPDHQRQRAVELRRDDPGLMVLGSPGSGKSSALRSIAHQAPSVLLIPSDAEQGWDAIALAERAAPGTDVIADDLDLLLSRLGGDYAAAARDRLERLAREARSRQIRLTFSAQRATGAVSRIAEAIPRRLLLAHANRADYLAAGGRAGDFARQPAGRGHLDDTLTQVLWSPESSGPPSRSVSDTRSPGQPLDVALQQAPWYPSDEPAALVAPDGPRTRAVLEQWAARGVVARRLDDPHADGQRAHVMWGPPDLWLAQWRALADARGGALLVIDVACAQHYRAITGDVTLPPYADPHCRRAWVRSPDGTSTRVELPGGDAS